MLTGKIEALLSGHSACVRDVSWHPYRMELIDTAWDGRHFKWIYAPPDAETELTFDSSDLMTDDSEEDSHDGNDWRNVRRSPRLAALRQRGNAQLPREPTRRSSRRQT